MDNKTQDVPEILTVKELADWLKMKPTQIYEMCRARTRARRTYPLPFVKLNGNLRFRRSDIVKWLEAQANRTIVGPA